MDRLERLLDAGRTLVAELDPDTVLDHLLQTAREITGARYAALGVLDERRTSLARFVTRGIDDETHRRIGDLPRSGWVATLPSPHALAASRMQASARRPSVVESVLAPVTDAHQRRVRQPFDPRMEARGKDSCQPYPSALQGH